jgi:hypothetical protein
LIFEIHLSHSWPVELSRSFTWALP